MEGAKLVMDVIALRGRCPECRKEFEIEDYHFACPTCGSTRIETIAGQDLAVRTWKWNKGTRPKVKAQGNNPLSPVATKRRTTDFLRMTQVKNAN